MMDYENLKVELLKKPEVKAEYEKAQPEFDIVRQFILARKKAKMSQSNVAKAMGKSRPYVARLESGKANPSIKSVRDYAKATGQKIVIEVTP